MTITQANGTVRTESAYNGGELKSVLAGKRPRRVSNKKPLPSSLDKAISAVDLSDPRKKLARELERRGATHAEVTERVAKFKSQWPGRRLTGPALLAKWDGLSDLGPRRPSTAEKA